MPPGSTRRRADIEQEKQSPAGGVTAHITIRDGRGDEAVRFYQEAFGAREEMRHVGDDGKRLMHAHLKLNGGSLLLNDDFPEMRGGEPASAPSGTTLHLDVPDADVLWDRAVAAGATVKFPLENQFWGARYGQLEDPFGHTWSIGGPSKA
ncbi:MAG TPA: VOC family protein [Croceibacterium sp.]|nr:VOC family protein [Propylenella sp.]HYD24123.1 VOC family protein [Croceibacterium sp.]